jgi:GWxTD domain-containing protein
MINHMRKCIFFLFTFFALQASFAQQIEGIVEKCVFNTQENEPYLETYISVFANTLTLHTEQDRNCKVGVEVTLIVKSGGKIINFDKFDLYSASFADSNNHFNLFAQRRMALQQGDYIFEARLMDLYDTGNVLELPVDVIQINFEDEVSVSDLHLIASSGKKETETGFSRGGVDLMPYMMPYYPTGEILLQFYAEIYGLDKSYLDEDILVTYSVTQPGMQKPLSGMLNYTKLKGQAISPIIGKLDIGNVPSGEYDLLFEVKDRQNNLLASKRTTVYRSNKATITDFNNLELLNVNNTFVSGISEEDLRLYLPALKPIGSVQEDNIINTILEKGDTVLMQQFLYNFWVDRDILKPERVWKSYRMMIYYTLENFEMIYRKGYETDRGRVYLQYGPPNDFFRSGFSAGTKPYEIWQYNHIPNGETNIRFVFLNQDAISNDFLLIHSDATGELRNERWELLVNDEFRERDNRNLDKTKSRDRFGNSGSEIFRDN